MTGLVWEGKTDSGDLRDKDNTYTWASGNAATNGGNAGTVGGGACTGSACDTEAYVTAVNTAKLCGFSDWRLPSAEELSSLLDLSVTSGASVNAAIANQRADVYWTATTRRTTSGTGELATGVQFDGGVTSGYAKTEAHHVRLVRGR